MCHLSRQECAFRMFRDMFMEWRIQIGNISAKWIHIGEYSLNFDTMIKRGWQKQKIEQKNKRILTKFGYSKHLATHQQEKEPHSCTHSSHLTKDIRSFPHCKISMSHKGWKNHTMTSVHPSNKGTSIINQPNICVNWPRISLVWG